jgi:hypothetical protein
MTPRSDRNSTPPCGRRRRRDDLVVYFGDAVLDGHAALLLTDPLTMAQDKVTIRHLVVS